METLDKVKSNAARLGACEKIGAVGDIASLARLFFSPQGREFCAEHNFPSMQLFCQLNKQDISRYGVYVDYGEVSRINDRNIALVGRTRGILFFDNVDCKHTVIMMHGASAKIIARDYAVVEVVNIGGCDVECEFDKTAKLL